MSGECDGCGAVGGECLCGVPMPNKPERINDGGAAFPRATEQTLKGFQGTQAGERGMTLRHWFAGQATEEDINSFRGFAPMRFGGQPEPAKYTRIEAKYRYADAMIAESGSGVCERQG